ncbi:penicillin-binding protein 1A [Brevibacillus laterosporus]|uniref:penicillin-binding protein 1A n=1 Tax=Brevibacillus laterosporus TaxID=1465 RepID=UPI0018CD9D1F|nr:penicillin-binding protein 1A [Brevibacillus laterosporus]MBG9787487.1 penicillin-binding protein [Brevibacillus laterosporus]
MQNKDASAKRPRRKIGQRGRKKHPVQAVLAFCFLLGFMGLFLVGGVATGYIAALVKDEPVRSKEEIQELLFSKFQTGFAYYQDGSLIGQLRAKGEDRRMVKISEISPALINAIIATEDKYFYEHSGIVVQSTLRGTIQELTKQSVVTGGSTLTQQLIKRTILSPEVSHKRKAKEILHAIRIERMFSKNQILEAYMNDVYFGKDANGSNIYGVQAAAKGIFGKDASNLDLAEASYLAGLPQSPMAYSPFNKEGYRRGLERQKMVLERMRENNYITAAQQQQVLSTNLQAHLAKPEKRAYAEHPFLMMEIEERTAEVLLDQKLLKDGRDKSQIGRNEYRQLLEEQRRQILQKGYHVYTTVHKEINTAMEKIAANPKNFGSNRTYYVTRGGKKEKIENALEEVGATLIDNKTGAIIGMMGGRDFNVEQTNHATAPRQPGSAMKPIAAYAPALELGLLQPGSPIDDSPVLLADGSKGTHLPLNWDRKYHGMMSAREALRQSWNVPAIKTYLKVGIPTALDYVKKMGVTTLVDSDNYAATGVIGGLAYGLNSEEITNAFSTFANDGNFVDAYMIQKIVDSSGNTVYEHNVSPVKVFSPQTAYLMTDMMRTVVNSGTGASVQRNVPKGVDIAGKTGTTNDSFDLWFVGYTPDVTLGVWTGYDVPTTIPGSAQRRPMEIWGKVMTEVFKIDPKVADKSAKFNKPSGIVSATIDSKSGLLPSELSKQTGHVITDLFNQRFVPTKVDDSHQKVRVVQVGEVLYLAQENTPDDFVTEGVFFKSPEPLPSSDQISAKNSKVGTKPADWAERMPEKEDPRVAVDGTPSAPVGVTTARSGSGTTLTWNASPEEDVLGYRIYRASVNGGFEKIATVKDPKTTSYTDTGRNDHGYYVTAVDLSGNESQASSTSGGVDGNIVIPGDSNPPVQPNPDHNQPGTEVDPIVPPDNGQTTQPPVATSAPSKIQGVSVSKTADGIKVSWKKGPAKDHITAYNVYYAMNGTTNYQLMDSVAETSFVLTTNEPGGSFYITAVNTYGESAPSAHAKVK